MKKKKVKLRDLKPSSEEQHSHGDGHNHNNLKSVSNLKNLFTSYF